MRLLRSLIVLLFVLTACTTSDDTSDDDSSGPTTTTTATTTTSPGADVDGGPVGPLVEPTDAPLRGLLAVVREGGGLDLVQADGTVAESLVADGDGPALQPTWASDGGRLAWVSPADAVRPTVVIAQRDGTIEAEVAMPFVPFYLAWSPDGRWIAALGNNRGEAGLAYVEVAEERSTQVVASAQGLYIAWDPESSGVVVHAGSEWGYLSLLGGGTSFGVLDAAFAAPVWIDGPGRAIVPTGSAGSFTLAAHRIDAAGEGAIDPAQIMPIATFDGRIWTVADPTSRRLAVLTTEDDSPVVGGGSSLQVAFQAAPPELEIGLSVLDLESGTVELVAGADDLTAGFFWDPTGERLLRLAIAPADGPLQWMVRRNDGVTVTLPAFTPTDVFAGAYLPFFDQYAQSISLFSPTGRAIAYAVVDDDGSSSIQLVDLARPSPEPRRITEGVLAVWSPR